MKIKTDLVYNWLDVLRALGACNDGIEQFVDSDGYGMMRSRKAWEEASNSQVEFVLTVAKLRPEHDMDALAEPGICPGCTFDSLPLAEQRTRFTYEQVRDALVQRYVESATGRARSLFDE